MTYFLIGLIALLSAYIIVTRIKLHKGIEKIIGAIKEIRLGNFNTRFRLQAASADMLLLGGELNLLTDFFQESLERAHALEEEKGQMASNISHDLRTPLTSMLGYIEALMDDAGLSSQERGEFLNIASEKGLSLLKLIEGFFELAILEEGAEGLGLIDVDLAEACRKALLGFYQEFSDLSIEPKIDVPDGPLNVKANPAYLSRILQNLLSNAMRYGSDGGEIGIEARSDQAFAWVSIWDNGAGIGEDGLLHAFDRLYAIKPSNGKAFKGTGLGLTIAKKLVELQGGQITAESRPYERTVFSFSLPLSNKT